MKYINKIKGIFKMNIKQLFEALESLGHYYRIENEHLKTEPLVLCDIDNKIEELKDLLYDAIEEGLKERQDYK
jgi:hypothetical protein